MPFLVARWIWAPEAFVPGRIAGCFLANTVGLIVLPARLAVLCSLVKGSRAGGFLSIRRLRGWFLSRQTYLAAVRTL
jgi:hypothetical protein